MSLETGLKDVHVLITGASGGIGYETALTFHNLGARVTAHYNTSPGPLTKHPDILALQADVRSETDITTLFTTATTHHATPVAILIINHGIWPTTPTAVADMPLAQFRNTLDVNLTGAFLLSRAYLSALRAAPVSTKAIANIVMIGSTAGKHGEAQHADYSASKAALMYGLVPSLKNEIVAMAPRGRVNAVDPGWVATPMAEATLGDRGFVERALSTTALRKVATTRDVARQVVVVASPELSGHVSGANLMVDGGMEGRLLWPPGGQE
ncbi:hypothetical protein MBLNU230_g0708t1 [Neophaeotheca triangularis]